MINQDHFYIQKYARSFYWSGFFLNKKKFNECSVLYAICRILDNSVDNKKKNRKLKFSIFVKNFKKKNISNIFVNKYKSIENTYIKKKFFFSDLIYGISLDLKSIRIKNQNELIVYSYYVGGTVGALMAQVLEIKNKKAILHAITLGIAMQLTNIARDVIEDAKLNRIYLPKTFFKKKISINNIQRKNMNKNVYEAVKKILFISKNYYAAGNGGIKYLNKEYRFAILLASNLYSAIGNKILKGGEYKYFNQRTFLTVPEKVSVTLKTFFEFIMNYLFEDKINKFQLTKLLNPLKNKIYGRI
ncbi:MAG: squalene/phytoene synthase family protein [Candidatus Fonsibacter sp.]|nr:hypothetical protein [Pelagibacterales bacterium]